MRLSKKRIPFQCAGFAWEPPWWFSEHAALSFRSPRFFRVACLSFPDMTVRSPLPVLGCLGLTHTARQWCEAAKKTTAGTEGSVRLCLCSWCCSLCWSSWLVRTVLILTARGQKNDGLGLSVSNNESVCVTPAAEFSRLCYSSVVFHPQNWTSCGCRSYVWRSH